MVGFAIGEVVAPTHLKAGYSIQGVQQAVGFLFNAHTEEVIPGAKLQRTEEAGDHALTG